ncbi:MAG TPA: ATP-binding protein [Phycisphaerae bacterium]|nr:ATP-binding protein [Phycisphaerae bacterium]HRW55574.1 ATP-binding protein [Phycisphaerae bacterium]
MSTSSETTRDRSATNDASASSHDIAMYAHAIERSNVAILIFDAVGNCLSANEAARQLTGQERPSIRELTSAKSDAQWRAHWEALAASGEHIQETEITRPDGHATPVDLCQSTFGYQGVDYGFMIIRDGSKQAEIERNLVQERSILQDILSTIPYVVFWKDRDSRYLGCNRALAESAGYTSPDELIGKSDYDMPWSREEADYYRKVDVETMARGEPILHFEETQQQKDGTTITLETSKVPLRNKEGEVIGILGIYTDVSERKRMESKLRDYAAETETKNNELLELNRQARAATKAKSEFLANMSHEIRTPMTAILGFAQILMESEIDDDQRDAIQTITRNGEHLLSLINDILDLSKIEERKMEVESIPCSPHDILGEMQSLMQVRAGAKRLRLTMTTEGEIPWTIRTDPTRLRQVLINLINNAIKFTHTGEIRVVTRFLPDAENPLLAFDVTDSGIGISSSQIHKLFSPFEQLDSSTTRLYGGSGLGLAISKQLAIQLGGDITVESTEGVGSRFTLTIAVNGPPGVSPEAHSAPPLPETPMALPIDITPSAECRVLLAEDGHDNQRLIVHMVRKAGAEVCVVDNGKAAVERAIEAEEVGLPFHVILMDMQMPIMDGYTATRALRKAGYAGKIVALTAHAMQGDRAKCMDAGCDDYHTKPIIRSQIMRILSACSCQDSQDDAAG